MDIDMGPSKILGEKDVSIQVDRNDLAECHGEAPANVPRCLWDILAATSANYPDHEAVVSLWQHQQGTNTTSPTQPDLLTADQEPESAPPIVRWTYQDLLDRSEFLAQWLQDRGCEPGMRLVVVLWNSAEWALFFWTAARLGMVFVPLDPRLFSNSAQDFLQTTEPAVLVVQDTETENALQESATALLMNIKIRISCSTSGSDAWISLPSVLDHTMAASQHLQPRDQRPDRSHPMELHKRRFDANEAALVVFTSGTTSSPKGCVHTTANLWFQTHDFDPNELGYFDRWLVHTPVSHIFAINNALRAWRHGDTVVFASKSFDVQSTLNALVKERCTVMSAVPALLKAILAQPTFPGKEALNLNYITLGSTIITKEDTQLAKEKFGSREAIQAFGMSEGAPMVSWKRSDPLLIDGFHCGIGKALPYASLRICAPGHRKPLQRNQLGELHIGGPMVITQYLNVTDASCFYTDEVGNWMATGDQAMIDDEGVLHITGRYKDLIIRGGENIPPIKIESALSEIPGVIAQVVGIPDKIAGQVPVAVVHIPDTCSVTSIREKARSLGTIYALDGVYTLQDLGIKSFPMTVTGKVKKAKLKEIVMEYRAKLEEPSPPPSPQPNKQQVDREKTIAPQSTRAVELSPPPSPQPVAKTTNNMPDIPELTSMTNALLAMWEDLLGFRPSSTDSFHTFADSITVLRYCDRVLKSLGQRIYLQDFADHKTPEELAKLLYSRNESQMGQTRLPFKTQRDILTSPPPQFTITGKAFPSTHTARAQELELPKPSPTIQAPARFTIDPDSANLDFHLSPSVMAGVHEALTTLGMGSADIEELLPVKDWFRQIISGNRPQSYRHRVWFRLGGDAAEPCKVRRALEVALSTRPTLRALLPKLIDGTIFHAIAKPSAVLFGHIIEDVNAATSEEADLMKMEDSAFAFSPLLATQARVIRIVSSSETILSLTYCHSIFDALSINLFHADLDRLLSAPDPTSVSVPPLTPFGLFAELLRSYGSSGPAQASVDHHVHRLRGISKFEDALWPPQRAPGWFIGSDVDSSFAGERAAVREQIWAESGEPWDATTAASFRIPRNCRVLNVPAMEQIRLERGILPQTVVRAGLAVFNALETGSPFAVFNTVEAGRSWPFVPGWMAGLLPPAESIDGPTVSWVLNMFRVDPFSRRRQETVGELVSRMRDVEAVQAQHIHAPWFKVLERLGAEEAAVAVQASQRQTFVWDMSVRQISDKNMGYATLQPDGRQDWPDCGIYWNCCMINSANLMIIASWDTAQMSSVEVDGYLDAFCDSVRKVADVDNWSKGLADVFSR